MAPCAHDIIFDTGEPAWVIDRRGIIQAWNSAASKVFGYSELEAVGRKCHELLQGKDPFGNQYCCTRCPLREMAIHHQPVNRCRMFFRTADEKLQGFTVSTLVVSGGNGHDKLLHLCRPESDLDKVGSAAALARRSAVNSRHSVLTPRESEVLHHLSDGHTTDDIATMMGINSSTVCNHVEHVLRKLHVHSRLEAVAVGRRLGLV